MRKMLCLAAVLLFCGADDDDKYKTYGPELDEYGQKVLHYDLKAANKTARDHTEYLTKKMEWEARSMAEWREHDKVVAKAKKMIADSLARKYKPCRHCGK